MPSSQHKPPAASDSIYCVLNGEILKAVESVKTHSVIHPPEGEGPSDVG